jgi:general nucleoside transport system ATP-binding protein
VFAESFEGYGMLARVRSVEKRFGELIAVRDVTCEFNAAEIHAVCGENGAGKSTLLKLVAGMLVPDAGEVVVGAAQLEPHTPREAIRRGVAMVLQHFALVPAFTALENIILGAEPASLGILDTASARARAKAIAVELGVTLPLDARVESLGIGDRQRIEIARALFRDARLVILDEPTAVLTKTEAAQLYATVRRLAAAGKGIVVVTHKMDEVREHADVVSVMRRGALVHTKRLDRSGDLEAQVQEVTGLIMSGHAAATEGRGEGSPKKTSRGATSRSEPAAHGEEVLVMKGVSVGRGLVDVSLTLRGGEIVGVAGVEGNGQRELISVLAGDAEPDTGSIRGGPFAIVRDDRQKEGLVLDASLRDNIMLGELGRFAKWAGVLDVNALEREARARIEKSGAPPDLDRAARTLSGGNQQKIVVTRALARSAKVVALAQPTRGVDLAASSDIHAKVAEVARQGAGVLIISTDLDELRGLASRIVVLARGRIVGELPNTATDDEIGRLMLGIAAAAPAASAPSASASAEAHPRGPAES